MVKLGMANSRMKDFFDIWILSRTFSFEAKTLSEAIQNTFARRKTPLPTGIPIAFTLKFYEDPEKAKQWKIFLINKKITVIEHNFAEVISGISRFILPVLEMINIGKSEETWHPDKMWQ